MDDVAHPSVLQLQAEHLLNSLVDAINATATAAAKYSRINPCHAKVVVSRYTLVLNWLMMTLNLYNLYNSILPHVSMFTVYKCISHLAVIYRRYLNRHN